MTTTEIAAFHRDLADRLRAEGSRLIEEGNQKLARAKIHSDMVGTLEPDDDALRKSAVAVAPNGITVDRLRSYLEHNGGRVQHVANHFAVAEDVVRGLIESKDSGIHIWPRGWLKLTPPNGAEK